MSTLITDSLGMAFEQEFRTLRPIRCEGFKLWMYNHNKPMGNFKLKLIQGMRTIKEWDFTSDSMQASFGGTEPYFHVYLSFLTESFILSGTYKLEVTHTGYTPTDLSFIGWNKDFDGVFGKSYPTEVEFTDYPYAFRILERV